MVNGDAFLDDDGNISWTSVVSMLFGGWLIAVGAGTASVIDTFFTRLSAGITNVAEFNRALLDLGFSMLAGNSGQAWHQLVVTSEQTGLLGMLLFSSEVLLVAWVFSAGRERYGI